MKTPSEPGSAPALAQIQLIKVDRIRPDPKNRKEFDPAEITSLAESIKAEGLLQPIVVRRMGPLEDPGNLVDFQIIAGERRWLAHKELKRETIEARVLDLKANEVAASVTKRAVENLQRVDLSPIETAKVYQELLDAGKSHDDIAKIAGRSKPDVSNTLRLLKLPADVQTLVDQGALTRAHGVALVRFAQWPKACAAIACEAIAQRAPAKTLEEGVPFYWTVTVQKHIGRHYFGKIPKELADDPDCIATSDGWLTSFDPGKLSRYVNRVAAPVERKVDSTPSGKAPAKDDPQRAAMAEARQRNHQRRGQLSMQFERALQDLRRSTICDSLMLAVLASEAVKGGYVATRIREVADKLGLKCPAGVIPTNGANGLRAVDAMAKMDPCAIAKLAVGVILSKETDDAIRNPTGFRPVNLDRYVDPKQDEKASAGRIVSMKAEAVKIVAAGGDEAAVQNKLGCGSNLAATFYKLASIQLSVKVREGKVKKLNTLSARAAALAQPAKKPAKAKKRGDRAVITDAIRAEVLKLCRAGKTGTEIAKAVGISLPSVQNIKKALGLVRR